MVKLKLDNRLRLLLMVICIAVFLFSGMQVVFKLIGYSKDNLQYESIRNMTERELTFEVIDNSATTASHYEEVSAPDSSAAPIPYEILSGDISQLNSDGILKDYEKLISQNPDLAAWIYMPGYKKVIDYPVMKTNDNDYYLYRDFYKNKSYAGSIFMDASNAINGPDRHIVLYGHAMRDMSMFGNLADYAENEEEYRKITKIYLDLMNTRLEYEVFSAYYEESTYNYRQIHFLNDEDYVDFLNRIRARSFYDFGAVLTSQDKIITLSTCNNDYGKDGRTIIHARLTRQITYDGTENPELVSNEGKEKKIISANTYLEKLLLQYDTADILPVPETVLEGEESPQPPTSTQDAAPAATPDTTPALTPVPPASTSGETPSTAVAATPSTTAAAITGNLVEVVTEPPFRSSKKEYTATVPAGLSKISITAVTADPKARILASVNDAEAALPTIELVPGENVVKLKVVSRDGLYAFTYTIKISWEPLKEEPPSTLTEPTPLPDSR